MIIVLVQPVRVAEVTDCSLERPIASDGRSDKRSDRSVGYGLDRSSPNYPKPTEDGSPTVLPRTGDVLRVTKAASVQFTQPLLFRVIRVHDWQTYDGWAWLDGYQLNANGDAVERRSIFVQLQGLQSGFVARNQRNAAPRIPVQVG